MPSRDGDGATRTSPDWNSVIAYRPRLEAVASDAGHPSITSGAVSLEDESPEDAAFVETLYRAGDVYTFDRGARQSEAEQVVRDPSAPERARAGGSGDGTHAPDPACARGSVLRWPPGGDAGAPDIWPRCSDGSRGYEPHRDHKSLCRPASAVARCLADSSV